MKKITLLCILFVSTYSFSLAQNTVKLNINHKLGEEDFAFETGAQNNIKNDFNFTRIQYYISEISIIHDGGIETAIEDYWILVDASKTTQENLGEYEINNVEGVSFHVGVDTAVNHLDPASYDPSHPLAPQNPSMHWGWFSGYRFIALEGNAGSNYDQIFELHGLGDDNYFKTEIEVSASPVDNVITINIDADYTRTLENITVNGGVIVHADSDESLEAIENFRDYVFSLSNTASLISVLTSENIEIYPNPSYNGDVVISIKSNGDKNYDMTITDVLGRQILVFKDMNGTSLNNVNIDQSGLYFISLIEDGRHVTSQKVIIN